MEHRNKENVRNGCYNPVGKKRENNVLYTVCEDLSCCAK